VHRTVAGKGALALIALDQGPAKSEWSIAGPGFDGAAPAVPAVGNAASATPHDGSAPTIIFSRLWVVFMLC
jgi:hypothetical protein